MEHNENPQAFHGSQLRPPSKIPSALFEMSASANNARANTTMPPPETNSLKHKASGLPNPIAKRKTLAQRAGETPRGNLAAPSAYRPVHSAVKTTTLAGARNPNFSASLSRTPSVSSTSSSTASFSSSMGGGSRAPSHLDSYRPQTALARQRAPAQTPASRPASSMDDSTDGNDGLPVGKRKGMPAPTPDRQNKNPSVSRHLFHDHRSKNIPASSQSRVYSESNETRVNQGMTGSSSVLNRDSHAAFTRSLKDIVQGTASLKIAHHADRIPSRLRGPSAICTPSQLPRPATACEFYVPSPLTPLKSAKRCISPKKLPFLTRDSNTQAWDTKGRLEDMEYLYSELKQKMNGSTVERNGLEETLNIYRSRVSELETIRTELASSKSTLSADLEATKARLSSASSALEDERRRHENQSQDMARQHRDEIDRATRKAQCETDDLIRKHREEMHELERRLKNEVEEERTRRTKEVAEVQSQITMDHVKAAAEKELKDGEIRKLKGDLESAQADYQHQRTTNQQLKASLSESATNSVSLESSLRSLRARIDFLESDNKSQAQSFADLQQQLEDANAAAAEAKEKCRKEETLRRKLHNQVQELKGNIRVFCRIRPILESEPATDCAKINFPDAENDSKELEVLGPEEKSSLGVVSSKKNAFSFDRVFGPNTQNEEVFEEISQLVQSALDGYNVCIFCYGQTGSGKTYTMSAQDGMIPRAVHQIYDTVQNLEEKGWRYRMEGSFVEVYNENLNDLLGRADEFDKKKHEIHHDMQKLKTSISDVTTVVLDTPDKVESILKRATANRSVAATKANERSSRSHSVFILRLIGENSKTGERSEGTLNLVDLAGSERLSHSGATGERLKETQNINRSLSCLGDVIGALGQGKEGGHVPYRNSKLTYLLQFSLGGNSKTLMFVMASPLQAHLSETLTSLKFATKVHNTHIGTAKRVAKIRD